MDCEKSPSLFCSGKSLVPRIPRAAQILEQNRDCSQSSKCGTEIEIPFKSTIPVIVVLLRVYILLIYFSQFTVPSEGPVVSSFCERVTPQEYKEQSLITSQRSLKDLLNRIVEDESLNLKDRKKQLKQVSFVFRVRHCH